MADCGRRGEGLILVETGGSLTPQLLSQAIVLAHRDTPSFPNSHLPFSLPT